MQPPRMTVNYNLAAESHGNNLQLRPPLSHQFQNSLRAADIVIHSLLHTCMRSHAHTHAVTCCASPYSSDSSAGALKSWCRLDAQVKVYRQEQLQQN